MKKLILLVMLTIATNAQAFTKKELADFEQNCGMRNGAICYNLGLIYEHGSGVKQNYKTAVKWYEKACNAMDFDGCFNLAVAYDLGRGVDKDPKKALEIYEGNCQYEHPESCFYAGYAYIMDKTVAEDIPKARMLFETACNHEHAEGCFFAGGLYLSIDHSKAKQLMHLGCALGSVDGCIYVEHLDEEHRKNGWKK